MDVKAQPGYETHLHIQRIMTEGTEQERNAALQELQRHSLRGIPKGMTIREITIPGGDGQPMLLRVYIPAGLPEKSPVLLNMHGGGWVMGDPSMDDGLCAVLAEETPCLAVGVDYRLCSMGGVRFPQPMQDCLAAIQWVREHGAELGGDGSRIALHGTSAGANLCEAAALYIRDHGGPRVRLVILNCPPICIKNTVSKQQFPQFSLAGPGDQKHISSQMIYLQDSLGQQPSYYAFPDYCSDLEGLPPHYVIVGEYDTLRDEGIEYAMRLLETGIPCELQVVPRVGHAFCTMDRPLTRWVLRGMCGALRREFGMEAAE